MSSILIEKLKPLSFRLLYYTSVSITTILLTQIIPSDDNDPDIKETLIGLLFRLKTPSCKSYYVYILSFFDYLVGQM